jgi:hypothetical protein
MDPNWVRSLRDQCRAAQVRFFFKQWGGVRKGRYGRVLDGETYDEIPMGSDRPIACLKDRRAMIAEVEPLMAAFA